MPGPPPKPAALRQRRNRKAGAREIAATFVDDGGVPDLYDRPCECGGEQDAPPSAKRKRGRPRKPRPPCKACHGTGLRPWHPRAIAYWKDLWTSEVRPHYLKVDVHGLYILIEMIDRLFRLIDEGSALGMLPQQIEQHRRPYGHTPLDRSRLHWEVKPPKPPDDEDRDDAPPPPVLDPRKVLRALA